jgi:GTP-binding protein EngB required for normal cell division
MKNRIIIEPRKLQMPQSKEFNQLEISVLGDHNSGKSFFINEIQKFFKGIHVKEEIIGIY